MEGSTAESYLCSGPDGLQSRRGDEEAWGRATPGRLAAQAMGTLRVAKMLRRGIVK
jgi:hypothetical protein